MVDELTTEALLRRCRKRPPDEAAWHEFVRRYHSLIEANVGKTFQLRAAQELERRPQFLNDSIDDLVQTVYFRLIDDDCRVLKAFRGEFENSFAAYLKLISINVVRDHFRRNKTDKRPKISFSLDELIENSGEGGMLRGVWSDIDGNRSGSGAPDLTMEDIDALLKKTLTRKDRDRNILIFKLRHCDGLTIDEIKTTLALDLSTRGIASVLSRINERIRRTIQKQPRPKQK